MFRNSVEDLKGQCHEILDAFLIKKLHLGPVWTGKNGFANFFIFRRHCLMTSMTSLANGKLFYFAKIKIIKVKVATHLFWIFSKRHVHLVICYADMCPRSCWPCWHHSGVVVYHVNSEHEVSVVVDYADMTMTMYVDTFGKTLKASHRFYRNSQAKKGIRVCLHTQKQ